MCTKKRKKKVVQKVSSEEEEAVHMESLLSDVNIITNRLFQIF